MTSDAFIQVQIENGPILEFPKGTSDDIIQTTVNSVITEQKQIAAGQVDITQPQAPLEIRKTVEALALQQVLPQVRKELPPGPLRLGLLGFEKIGLPVVQFFSGETEKTLRIRASGVETEEGVPSKIRAGIAFSADARTELVFLKKNLEEHFKNEGVLGEDEEIDVRKGPVSEELEYFDPRINRYRLVNQPGFDIGDLATLPAQALSEIPDIAASIGVFLVTKSPQLGIAAGAVGAYAGEYARLKLGQAFGLSSDLNEVDLHTLASKKAGISVAFGEGGVIFAKARSAINNFLSGRSFMGTIGEGIDDIIAAESAEVVTEVNAKLAAASKGPLSVTTGEFFDDPDFLALQEVFLKSQAFGQTKKFRSADRLKTQALKDFFEIINQPFTVKSAGPSEFGRKAVATAEAQLEKVRKPAQVIAEKAAKIAEEAFEKLPVTPAEEVGLPIREVFENEVSKFRAWAQEGADALDRLAIESGSSKIQNKALAKAATKLSDESKNNILPIIGTSKKKIIGVAPPKVDLKRALEEGTFAEVIKTGKKVPLFEEGAEFTFREYWDTISELDRLIRISSKGLATEAPNVGDLKFIKSALEVDAERSLKGTPIAEAFDVYRAKYRLEQDRLSRSIIGSIIGKEERLFKIPPEKIVNSLLKSATEADAAIVGDIMSDNPRVHTALKEAIADIYTKTVDPNNTGKINIKAHNKFIRDHGRKLTHYMGESLETISKVGELQKLADKALLKQEKLFKDLQKTFPGRIENLSPGRIFSEFWKPGTTTGPDLGELELLVTFLGKNSPQTKAAFQKEIIRDMRNRITTLSGGERKLSYVSLEKYLLGSGGESGHETAIRIAMGDEYANNLDIFRKAMQLTSREATAVNRSGTAPVTSALNHLARIYFGMFTAKGRALTAAQRIGQQRANKLLAEVILDPDKLKEIIKLATLSPESQQVAVILSKLGGHYLTGVPSVSDIETKVPEEE